MASSLDCPWTITKTVKDAWILYEIMNWEDEKENTTLPWKDIIDNKIWSWGRSELGQLSFNN